MKKRLDMGALRQSNHNKKRVFAACGESSERAGAAADWAVGDAVLPNQ